MECNDEAVERQKLVPNDGEIENEEEPSSTTITATPAAHHPTATEQVTPASPVMSNKDQSGAFSSGDTSRGKNSGGWSTSKGESELGGGAHSARLIYVNEKKADGKTDYKPKTRKVQRDPVVPHTPADNSFASRPLKHHCFLSEVPDVRHMERALLGLLDDFHSGKLRAFGSGCTMEQMTDIREQQERLAKLHFELGGDQSGSTGSGDELHTQENMCQLVQKLEQLSVSIEKLHSSNTGL